MHQFYHPVLRCQLVPLKHKVVNICASLHLAPLNVLVISYIYVLLHKAQNVADTVVYTNNFIHFLEIFYVHPSFYFLPIIPLYTSWILST